LAISSCAPLANVNGIVIAKNGPLDKPQVEAYPDYYSLSHGLNAITSSPGEHPGQFKLRLRPGSYYLTARGSSNQQELFSYHGLNPISITEDDRWLPFFAVPAKEAVCSAGYQGIGGQVYFQGEPAANGGISVYSLDDPPFRGMGLLTNTIISDGSYWFDLEPGSYVLVARKRRDQSGIGPLKPGDLFCYSDANPIDLKAGMECQVDLYCYPRNDIDTFLSANATDPRGRREENRRSLAPRNISPQAPKTIPQAIPKFAASISGQVRDRDGMPRPGLFVAAFPADDLDLFQMYIVRLKTPFMTITDKEGRYSLDLESGSYYLVAREKVGVAPEHLEYFGIYEGSANHSLRVRPGEVREDGDILVGRVMP